DNAFINFYQNGWFAAPNYVVMKLWREHYAPHWLETTGDTKGMYVSTTKSDDGTVYVKVVNPMDVEKNVTVTLRGTTVTSATMELVAPGAPEARNTLEFPETVHVEPGTANVTDEGVTFTLPPLSAAVVTCE
ncbi:MAG: alpha-L-arabinofuranosidase C-terminal domain-containing protein, partial [Planctomycetia bacterium]|nr:alpha-L-arabinofuranosidase C-terminal domain-containing protein [Planctomycetia bacterium]